MITTKADELVRSLIEAGLFLTDFTILATKVTRIQRDFQIGHEDRRQRDRLRQQEKIKEQNLFEQQLKTEEERRQKGLVKLRELGYVTNDENSQLTNQTGTTKFSNLLTDVQFPLTSNFYSKEINEIKQKQRDCCLSFNIDYDLRLNQENLERACRSAKRNIYQLRADRFNRPEYRSILSVETITQHNKLKEAIRELNRVFLGSKSSDEQRIFHELISYINQYEGDVDLLMCQMQYEPKVKETILFAPVTTDILDRMNLILHLVRSLAKKISKNNLNSDENEFSNSKDSDLFNLPNKATYVIKVKTNDHAGSSLSDESKVTVKLYGTNNKSPEVRLIQSINQTKWQPGQIDLFNIEMNYLGEIYAMEIGHDNEYSSWKVDWIDIIDDGANVYRFPVDRLIEKMSEDKTARFLIQRDIGPVRRLPPKTTKSNKPYKQIGFSTYKVQVKTGKQPNKATDSSIFLQLKGENGNFSDHLCSANSAFKGSVFEPDQLDTFYLVWPDLGQIDSLNLSIQSDGANPPWFCEFVTVEESQKGENYKFIINQLFDGSNTDDRHAKKTFVAHPEKTNEQNATKNSTDKTKPSYLLKIKTGEQGLAETATRPAVSLVFQNEKNKSNPHILQTSDKKRTYFRENQTDEFVIPSEFHVEPMKSLTLNVENLTEPWFIENLIVRDIQNGQDFIFPLFRTLNDPSGKTSITISPLNERKPEYVVYTRTIASEIKGPDRSIKLNLQGKKGTEEIQLAQPVSMFNSFQPGRKDEFYIDRIKSLGEIQSIEVDVTHPNIKKLGLDYVEIKHRSTNESFKFNINRILDAKNPKIIAKAEQNLRPNTSLTKVSTGTKPTQLLSSGNDQNKKNLEQMSTSIPQGAKRPTRKNKSDDDFPSEKAQTTSSDELNRDDSSVNIPSVADLKCTTISADENFDTKRSKLSSSLSSSTPTAEILDEKRNKTYKTPTTMSKEKVEKKTNKNFLVQLPTSTNDTDTEGSSASKLTKHEKSTSNDTHVYQIKLKTLKREFLDKETKLQVELIDDKDESEQKILDPTMTLDKGKIDSFSIETKKNFDQLKKIKLSLIGSKSKKQDVYQAEFVEIIDPKLQKTHRVDYTKDDILNVDKKQIEIIKSLRETFDSNDREKAHPQGSSPPSNTFKTPLPPKTSSSPIDRNLLQHDAEDISSIQQTLSSSTFDNISKDLNSTSERISSSASRQIRPGDRVKSSSNRQLFKDQSKMPMYEANWYRRSVENGSEHQEQLKQQQLFSSQRTSQTKFDKQTAKATKLALSPPPSPKTEGPKKENFINRQGSKDKKMNGAGRQGGLLPKKSSSKSLKQQTTSQIPANLQKHWNELHTEMIDDRNKMSTKQFKLPKENSSISHDEKMSMIPSQVIQQPMQKYVDKPANFTAMTNLQRDPSVRSTYIDQPSSSSQTNVSNMRSSKTQQLTSRSVSDDQTSFAMKKEMSIGESHHDPTIIIDSPVVSNIFDMNSTSQTRAFAKPSSTTHQSQNDQPSIQSMGTRHTKSTSQTSRSQGTSTSSATSTLHDSEQHSSTKTSTSTLSKNVPSNIRSTSDQNAGRSVGVSSTTTSSTQNSSSKSNTISLTQTTQSDQISNEKKKSSMSTFSSKTGADTMEVEPSNPSSKTKISTSNYIIDSILNERERQINPNTQGISSVSIHTIATKSDSDSHMSRKSTGSHDSEYSLRNDSLLSPESAKKLRRKRRQEQRSKTLEDIRTQQTTPSQTNKSSSNPSITTSINKSPTVSNEKYLSKETSDIQYASRSASSTKLVGSELISDKSRQISHDSQMAKSSHPSSVSQSTVSTDTRSKQTTSQSASTSTNISSTHLSVSTTTGQSSQSFSNTTSATTTAPSDVLSKEGSQTRSDASSTTRSTTTTTTTASKGNVYSSNKINQVEQMSTVFEESEPSTGSATRSEKVISTQRVDYPRDRGPQHEWTETTSGSSSRTASPSASHQPFRSPSKFENFVPLRSNLQSPVDAKVKHPTTKSPPASTHPMKTIDAKSVTKNNTIDYEFRIQTGNGSRLDGTNEPVIVELTDEHGNVTQIPLQHSINNSKAFQKGQLDIFHLALPENFHSIKKLNLSLPKSNRDPLHIRYCELQDRQTMNTLYFPIETWLGEKNTFDIDMFINKNQNSER